MINIYYAIHYVFLHYLCENCVTYPNFNILKQNFLLLLDLNSKKGSNLAALFADMSL